jgi:hypothetical protein
MGKIYSFTLHISKFVLLLLWQRRSAAVATWVQRSSTCEKQRADLKCDVRAKNMRV